MFAPHLVIAGLLAAGLGAGVLLGHSSWVFLAWGSLTAGLFAWARRVAGVPAGGGRPPPAPARPDGGGGG